MRKKLLSLALALCMLLGLLPTAAFAADIASGTCGNESSWPGDQGDITWRLTSDGTLVLEGTGATKNYDNIAAFGNGLAPWDSYVDQIRKVYVGKGITRLGSYLFFKCKKATEFEIEDGNQLKYISALPPHLEKITAPNGKNYFTYPGDIALYVRNYVENMDAGNYDGGGDGKPALSDYPSMSPLTSYTVKEGTEVICAYAFYKANKLKEIVLPDGVTQIGLSAFENCYALEKLDLPESLTQLDSSAFWGCDALKTVIVPASVTSFECHGSFSDYVGIDRSRTKAYIFSGDAPTMRQEGNVSGEKYTIFSFARSSEEYDEYEEMIKSCIYYPQNASGWEELAQEYTNELTEFIPYDPAVGPFPKPSVTPDTVTIKDADPVYMIQGDTKVLTVETDPAGGEVYWLSSDTSVVTVDRTTGKLTAVAPGSAQVTVAAVLGEADDSVTVWVTKPSSGGGGGGGGSSSGSNSTVTTKNPDGSVTKTVTNKRTGTVTVTTTAKDGTKTVVETTKDGTVTKTVTDPKGGKITAVTKNDNTATITLSGGKTQAVVELPVKAGVGTVAVIVHADGTEEIIKTTVPAEEGVKFLVNKNVTVQFKDNAKTFTDIPVNSWAKDAIDFVSARGIFKGTSETTFTPTQEIDRAMMATLLFRLADGKAEGKNTFADVPKDTWYTDSVLWANANGIVTGYDNGAFGPTDVVTREQMAVMFYRYAKLLDMDTTVKGDLGKFTDMAAASDWAVEAMTWCVGAGLMNGTSDTTISPNGTASRAEVAAMLMRIVELMVD